VKDLAQLFACEAVMHLAGGAVGDVLAPPTTMRWNILSNAWTGSAVMADASLNRRMTVRLAEAVAYAQIGIVGFDGQIELEALRLYGLPEHAPALLCGTSTLPVGQREFAAEVTWDLPNLAPGLTSLLEVTVAGCRQGDSADAALASTRFIELDAAAWTNNTVRVMARNISGATFDLAAATLSVQVTKRRMPWPLACVGWQRCSAAAEGGQAPSKQHFSLPLALVSVAR
jgi:hypothetical protein